MAEIDLEIVNNSGQTVGLRVEENGETHEYLKKLVRREDLHSVRKAPARKAPAGGKTPPTEK